MIKITQKIWIDEKEINQDFIHSPGPGGQNVNKVATSVQLRFDVRSSPSLPEDVRDRLIRLGGKRVNKEGILIINARRFRTQERNRQDAIERLTEMIARAAERPRIRRATRPTLASKTKRLKIKKHRGTIKRMRRSVKYETE